MAHHDHPFPYHAVRYWRMCSAASSIILIHQSGRIAGGEWRGCGIAASSGAQICLFAAIIIL
jgi:urease accessory protein UreH